MKKYKILILFIILFSYSSTYSADITFSQALESLYGTHEGMAQAEADYKQKEYSKKAALGLYSPRISLNAAYAYFGNDLTMDVDLSPVSNTVNGIFGSLGGVLTIPLPSVSLPNSMEQIVQKDQFFTLNAAMIWPVFTGGKIYAANKAASANLDIAKYGKTIRHDELGISLAEKYFTLRFIQDIIALKQDVKDSMQEHYNKALKLEKAGMLAKVERLHAEMALSDAEKSLDTSLREAKLVESALKSMISSTDENINPSTPLFLVKAEDIESLAYFQDMASSSNAKLKQAQTATKLAHAGVINSTSSFIPKINAFGMVNIYDYQLSSLSPDYMVGVQMSINLFDGLQNYHQLKSSKTLEESTKLMAARAEKDIRTLVEQQYITMENARADYNSSLKSLAFAEEYLRARQKAFNQGMATSLDVVDAELALSNSKMSAIQAAYKFDMALITMLATSGMFDNFESYRAKAFVEPGLK
ncbi:MAG: TolC family protein [Mucispirillum sp.]|uniref:TolC family protein n=1 Tax=Candidatus Mucispirillum faecigallinarum TaxID=2838699 RepID=A0A9D2KB53_9BACT|nr:TolC family protein [Mucispirillum sp.]HIZ88432.1 TolC family protein [Candidatus Mucispirillum faecigallinarum]